MLEIKNTVFEIKIYDEVVEVRSPLVSELQSYNKQINKKGADTVELMIGFLTELGIKKETVEKLEARHMVQIISHVSTASESEGKK